MNGLDFGTTIGLIKGLGSPDPAVIEGAVSDWLDDHPEATTTVQDGSITKAKLDSNLQGTVDDVADLKSALNYETVVLADGWQTIDNVGPSGIAKNYDDSKVTFYSRNILPTDDMTPGTKNTVTITAVGDHWHLKTSAPTTDSVLIYIINAGTALPNRFYMSVLDVAVTGVYMNLQFFRSGSTTPIESRQVYTRDQLVDISSLTWDTFRAYVRLASGTTIDADIKPMISLETGTPYEAYEQSNTHMFSPYTVVHSVGANFLTYQVSVDTYVESKYHIVTPQLYGAYGDGVHDDTDAFQKLDGKTAFIPEGTYLISGRISYERNTVLIGAGTAKTILRQINGDNTDFIVLRDPYGCSIRNLTIQGDVSFQSYGIYHALLKLYYRGTPYTDTRGWYSLLFNIAILDSPGSGLVLLGSGHTDEEEGTTDVVGGNLWAFNYGFITIRGCLQYAMVDESTDNRFVNLHLSSGKYGSLYCNIAGSNMYANVKLDGGISQHTPDTEQPTDALLVINRCKNIRFVNLDAQSALYDAIKIFRSSFIFIDGCVNNYGQVLSDAYALKLMDTVSKCYCNIMSFMTNSASNKGVLVNANCGNNKIVFVNENLSVDNDSETTIVETV